MLVQHKGEMQKSLRQRYVSSDSAASCRGDVDVTVCMTPAAISNSIARPSRWHALEQWCRRQPFKSDCLAIQTRLQSRTAPRREAGFHASA
jgi:hypothetical protein